MKAKIKQVIIPIFLSIVLGSICGRIVYSIYSLKTDLDLISDNKVYLIQTGAYSSYDNMRTNAVGYDYVYYEENDLYKTIIGLTKNKKNIEKITSTYEDDVIVSEYYLNDSELIKKIDEYDEKLMEETDSTKIKNIILEMLDLYKANDITLTKAS